MSTHAFTLHPQLSADTFPVVELKLCDVRLMNDARYAWLILVPRENGLTDFHDLPADQATTIFTEIDVCSRALQALYEPIKINVAALGNLVPQLHIHIIARQADDEAWPGPVWGVGTAKPYPAEAAEFHVERLATQIGSG